MGRHRRLQSAPRPPPGRLTPPAQRSRARAELSLFARRRARPYDPPRRAPGAGALPRAQAWLCRAARGGPRTPRRPPRRPARRAGARHAAESGARLRPHATAMRKALTDLARAENRPAGATTNGTPAEARAEPAGDATTHDRQGSRYVGYSARARNSTRAEWRPAPSHPWRRAATAAVEAKKRRKPIHPGG